MTRKQIKMLCNKNGVAVHISERKGMLFLKMKLYHLRLGTVISDVDLNYNRAIVTLIQDRIKILRDEYLKFVRNET